MDDERFGKLERMHALVPRNRRYDPDLTIPVGEVPDDPDRVVAHDVGGAALARGTGTSGRSEAALTPDVGDERARRPFVVAVVAVPSVAAVPVAPVPRRQMAQSSTNS